MRKGEKGMARRIASFCVVALLGATLLTCSAALAFPPSFAISADNFSANGPISGTNVRVHLTVSGSLYYNAHQVWAVFGGTASSALVCIPDPGYPDNWYENVFVTNGVGAWSGTVVVCSTAWSDDAQGSLLLRVKVGNHPSQPFDSNTIAGLTVQNDGLVLGYEPFAFAEELVGYVGDSLTAMNHSTTESLEMDQDDILEAIPGNTVFYAYTHGELDCQGKFAFHRCFGDMGDPDVEEDWWIDEDEVSAAVGDKDASQPSYNLVVMHCCHSADSASAPGTWGISEDDNYYLGFQGTGEDSRDYADFIEDFFDDVQAGNTAEHARGEAEDNSQGEVTNSLGFGDDDMRLNWAYESSLEF